MKKKYHIKTNVAPSKTILILITLFLIFVCKNNAYAHGAITSITVNVVSAKNLITENSSSGTSTSLNAVSIKSIAAPSNNQCTNATLLPCGTSNLAGTTVGTSSFTHGSGCSMSNYGVWYTFTGDGNQNTITATTTSFDIEMAIKT